jgi:hypothetical protein
MIFFNFIILSLYVHRTGCGSAPDASYVIKTGTASLSGKHMVNCVKYTYNTDTLSVSQMGHFVKEKDREERIICAVSRMRVGAGISQDRKLFSVL